MCKLAEMIIRCLNNDAGCKLISHSENVDALAEVRVTTTRWNVDAGMQVLFIREDDLHPGGDSRCPECWIRWEIVDHHEVAITPKSKSFISECQQNYWLKQQLNSFGSHG